VAEDIIIVDSEFDYESGRVYTDAESIETVITKLSNELEAAKTSGLVNGDTAENFSVFVELVKEMQGKLLEIAEEEKSLISNMIAEVDDADQHLYGDI